MPKILPTPRVAAAVGRLLSALPLLGLGCGLGLGLGCGPAPGRGGAAASSAPRSVLLVTLDTTRRDALSPYDADPSVTPHLARLAEQGSLFLDAYSALNVTNPAHASMFSGLPARGHGVFDNATQLPAEVETLPEVLRRAGYATAAFPAVAHVWQVPRWRGFELLRRAEGRRTAGEVVDDLVAWLEERRQGGRPFFAWAHFYDAHTPYEAPPEVVGRFYEGDPTAGEGPLLTEEPYFGARQAQPLALWLAGVRDREYPEALYRAAVSYVDRELGRAFAALEAAGLADDTVVVVVADHGESLGEHGLFYTHAGLFEPQIRIPFIVRVPGLPGGLRHDETVTHLDLAPTLGELLGVAVGAGGPGRSLVPLLAGGRLGAPATAMRVTEAANNHQVAVRDGSWKLIWPINRRHEVVPVEPLLFDLARDPAESRDLAAAEEARLRRMAAATDWWREKGERLGGELPAEQRRQLEALGYVE